MAVQQIAVPDVVTCGPTDSLADVVTKMEEHDVGAVVVVAESEPIGILTDRSIALACKEHESLPAVDAADIMTEDIETVSGETGIFDVIRNLNEAGVRRMPVVDSDGSLEGIVTFDDLVVLLTDEFDELSDVVRQQARRF